MNKCIICGDPLELGCELCFKYGKIKDYFTFGYGSKYDYDTICVDCLYKIVDPIIKKILEEKERQ